MIALDSSFLIDYLAGVEATARFLEQREEPVYYAPTIVLYEIYEGAARYDGDSIDLAEESLEWVEPLEFDLTAAREAAQITVELRADGAPINAGAVLIAGTCRRHGATLVTRDDDFSTVDRLETVSY